MQTTTELWKKTLGCYNDNNRPSFVPFSDIKIVYGISDEEAQANASASANTENDISDTEAILENSTSFADYISLEQDIWLLNGNQVAIDDQNDTPSYVSGVLSENDNTFTTNPIITLSWGSVQTIAIPGLTLQWSSAYGQYAEEYELRAYNGGTLIETLSVTDNTDIRNVVNFAISNYDKIEIEIIKWSNPQCYARLEYVMMGLAYIFTKEDLISYTHKQSCDLLSFNLPDNFVRFEIYNRDDEWNPSNPQGKAQYLKEMQKISIMYGYELSTGWEWIEGGEFYLSEWDTPQNSFSVTFVARSVLEKLLPAKANISGTKSFYDIIDELLTSANLPTNADGSDKWEIDNSLQNISITIPSGLNLTIAEMVQLCANACECVFYIDRNGTLKIEPLNAVTSDYYIDPFVSYSYAEYDMGKPIKKVAISNGNGSKSYVNDGVETTITNPLILNATRGNSVAEWIGDMLNHRNELEGEYRSDPRVDVLDKVTVKNKYSTETIILTELTFNYNGVFKGNYKGRVV